MSEVPLYTNALILLLKALHECFDIANKDFGNSITEMLISNQLSYEIRTSTVPNQHFPSFLSAGFVPGVPEGDFFIDNLLVRIHFIIVMIRWTGLAPWEFEFPFPGSIYLL